MTNQKYILGKNHELIAVDLMEWAKWFKTADRHVAQTQVGKYWVSTVFLGLDHNFSDSGEPLLFETMVFFPAKFNKLLKRKIHKDVDMERYATWDEAEAGHKRMVEKYRRKTKSG